MAILGAGPTGVMHTLLARLRGANKIVVSDINEFRLGFLKQYGVATVNLNQGRLEDAVNKNTNNRCRCHSLATGSKGI